MSPTSSIFENPARGVSPAAVAGPTPTSYLTVERVLTMNDMSAILAGLSAAVCLAVLAVIAMLFSKPESRQALDRLSFRLLVYALIADVFYSIGYIICVKVSSGFWCVAGPWLIQFWLGVANWFVLCIALNLQLVLVHAVNGLALEKWYTVGPIVLNLAITIPPLVKNKFGWDPVIAVCWLTDSDSHDRLVWQISTQLLWILLAALITTVCALVTILYLYKHKFTTRRFINQDAASTHNTTTDLDHDKSRHRCFMKEEARSASRSLATQHGFRNVIVRISLYPIVMTVVNLIITIGDIRISTVGIFTRADFGLYIIYYALYGGRGIFYAVMAILDPSFLRAIKIWRGLDPSASTWYQYRRNDPEMLAVADNRQGISVQTKIVRREEEIEMSAPPVCDATGTARSVHTEVTAGAGAHRWGASDSSVDEVRPDLEAELSTSNLATTASAAAAATSPEDRCRLRDLWRTRQRLAAESAVNRQI